MEFVKPKELAKFSETNNNINGVITDCGSPDAKNPS